MLALYVKVCILFSMKIVNHGCIKGGEKTDPDLNSAASALLTPKKQNGGIEMAREAADLDEEEANSIDTIDGRTFQGIEAQASFDLSHQASFDGGLTGLMEGLYGGAVEALPEPKEDFTQHVIQDDE